MALRWSARIELSPGYRHAAPLERESQPGEDLYGISIAFAIHSLDQSLSIPLISYKGPVDGRRGRESRPGEDLYGTSMGFLSRSLSSHLITRYPLV